MAKIEQIPTSEIMRSHPSGVMSERQLRAVLLGYYARVLKTRDRRGMATAVGEMPKGAVEYGDDGRPVSIAGEKIMANAPINHATGLPESAGALLPNHRAVMGWELALSLIIPPEDFIATCIYTDDVPQNVGKSEDEKEWVALNYKPKFKVGPGGQPLAAHKCLNCNEEWEAELHGGGRCLKCNASGFVARNGARTPVVDRRVLDGWTDEEVFAVKENTHLLKRIVDDLATKGYFVTKPRIDEHPAELGTDTLGHGADGMTMGFQITPAGLKHAEEFAKANPILLHGHHILDAMGKTQAEKAPEWVKAARRAGEAAEIAAAAPPERTRTAIDPPKLKKPKLAKLKKKSVKVVKRKSAKKKEK